MPRGNPENSIRSAVLICPSAHAVDDRDLSPWRAAIIAAVRPAAGADHDQLKSCIGILATAGRTAADASAPAWQ
jgi:hypothetical protein